MNKLEQWHEERFQFLTRGDPCYFYSSMCVARVADPSEQPVGSTVFISRMPYRVIAILRRGVDEFSDGGIFYCYGYRVGPYRPSTPGRYLRKQKEGPRDPTMTHVEDPYRYNVGDIFDGRRIVAIRETPWPDTRFVYLR